MGNYESLAPISRASGKSLYFLLNWGFIVNYKTSLVSQNENILRSAEITVRSECIFIDEFVF
jgi:hypothetical protein